MKPEVVNNYLVLKTMSVKQKGAGGPRVDLPQSTLPAPKASLSRLPVSGLSQMDPMAPCIPHSRCSSEHVDSEGLNKTAIERRWFRTDSYLTAILKFKGESRQGRASQGVPKTRRCSSSLWIGGACRSRSEP